jgi:hypothetical protein
MRHAQPFVVAAGSHPRNLDGRDLEQQITGKFKQTSLFAYQAESSRTALSGEF